MITRIDDGITVITADEGKILKCVADGVSISKEFWLGCNDSVENYIEIDTPPVETDTTNDVAVKE